MKTTSLTYNTVDFVVGLQLGANIFYKDGSSTFTMNTEVAHDLNHGDVVGFDTHGRIWSKMQ